MNPQNEKIGNKFGRLTILSQDDQRPEYYFCECECGKRRYFYYGNLKNGRTKSCGCYKEKIKRYSNVEEVLSDLKITLKKLGYIPTSKEYRDTLKFTSPNFDTFRVMDLTYPLALQAAGFPHYGAGARILKKYRICQNDGCFNSFLPNETEEIARDTCHECNGTEAPQPNTATKKDKLSNTEYTDEEILLVVSKFCQENPSDISGTNYKSKLANPSYLEIVKRFGNWKNALRKAVNYEEIIIANMKRCSEDGLLDIKRYKQMSLIPSWSYIQRNYDVKYLLKKADLKVANISRKEVIQDFFELPCEKNGMIFSTSMINEYLNLNFKINKLISLTPYSVDRDLDKINKVKYVIIFR